MKQYRIDMFRQVLRRFSVFVVLVVGCLMSLSSKAQQVTTMRDVIPPSPDAAALGKYGQYPVTLSNGLVNIGIPIYTIKTNSIELPIALSYHASGMKVDEVCSWVGLGWSLNAGGVITRVVRDQPDNRFGIANLVRDRAYYVSLTGGQDVHAALSYASGDVQGINPDDESDIYYYNINGLSGSFRYDTQGNLVQIPLSNNQIAYDYTLDEFTLTGTDGTVYKFSDREKSRQGSPQGVSVDAFTSSWYVTTIVTADSEEIRFKYFDDTSWYEEWSEVTEVRQCVDGFQINGCPTAYAANRGLENRSMVKGEVTKVLQSITFPGGSVGFSVSDDRLDRRKYRLTGINISTNAAMPVKSISLEHSYFVPGPGTGVSTGVGVTRDANYRNHTNYRLKLDAITVGADRYVFGYNTSVVLPQYYDPIIAPGAAAQKFYGQDYWGYYNAVTTNTSFNSAAPPAPAPQGLPLANRSINETAAQACMLNSITYPTGGITEFKYESNRGWSNTELVGGLRIRQLISRDFTGRVLTKTFRYEDPLPNFDSYNEVSGAAYSQYVWDGPQPRMVLNFYVSSPPAPLTYEGGAPVFYRKVTEFIGTEEDYIGKTVQLFSAIQDFEFNAANQEASFPTMPDSRPFYPKYKYDTFNFSWRRGEPYNTSIYSRENGVDKLIKSVVNTYSEYLVNTYVKVGFYAFKFKTNLTGDIIPSDPYEVRANHFQFDDIVIKTGIKKLIGTVETNYTNEGEIVKTINYAYERLNNQYAVTSETQQASDGSILKKTYQYPNDLKTGQASDVYTTMSTKNITSPVVIETDYKNDQLVQSVRTNYRKWDNNIFAPETIELGIGNNAYVTSVTYRNYDNIKNPLSVLKKDGLRENYIWGYQNITGIKPNDPKRIYPVVKIEGGADFTIDPALMTAIQAYAFSGSRSYSGITADVVFLNNQLSTLRSNPSYKVTSYTYAPLVGITSSTDANGITTYYEYDAYSRLIRVRDNDGKYVKMLDYKMVGQ